MKLQYRFVLGLLFPLAILLGSLLSACAAQTPTSKPQSTVSSPTPVVSSPVPTATSTAAFDGYALYESCSPNEEAICLSHLNTMAEAGFKLVLNYDEIYGDASFQKAYLAHAQALGMKVIMPLKEPAFYNGANLRSEFPALAATCDCTDNTGFLHYVVDLVKNNPALWGYYIGDEVDPDHHDALKSSLADVVHQLDPKHPRLFIDNAGESTSVWHGNSPFFDTADVIGTDFYPIRIDSSDYPTIDQTGAVASGIQAYADAHNEGSAIVLQAFSYSEYGTPGAPYPTAEQLQWMLSQTLAHAHPRIILWYSFYDTMSYANADQHWNDLKAVIARNTPKA